MSNSSGEQVPGPLMIVFDQLRDELRSWSWAQYLIDAGVNLMFAGVLAVVHGQIPIPISGWVCFLSGSMLLTVAVIAWRRNAAEWRADRQKSLARANTIEDIRQTFLRLHHLIEDPPKELHGPAAMLEWEGAASDALQDAENCSRRDSLPGEVRMLIFNPKNRPSYDSRPVSLGAREAREYRMVLARRGLVDVLEECERRGWYRRRKSKPSPTTPPEQPDPDSRTGTA